MSGLLQDVITSIFDKRVQELKKAIKEVEDTVEVSTLPLPERTLLENAKKCIEVYENPNMKEGI